eukprot:TRINITY_DN1235_c0_g1_i1.p1 TRINITY_DN1235_c0_g1~~TRINITY_DN1235_c0_g1_i1.p1  ORF type:complete len:1264 (-),score=158.24 TRINITY_DN1235_c0_g1_i1:908-4609(-)
MYNTVSRFPSTKSTKTLHQTSRGQNTLSAFYVDSSHSTSKLNIRYSIPDEKAGIVKLQQASKFFTPEDSQELDFTKPILPKISTLSQSKTQYNTVGKVMLKKHLSESVAKIPSRDVSYMLDQGSTRFALNKSKEEFEKEELFHTMGLLLDSSVVTQKYPETMEELKALQTEIKHLEVNSSGTKVRLLLKSDIFKEVPKEFYQKCPKFFAEICSRTQQRDLQLSHNNGFEFTRSTFGAPASRYDAIALLKWLDKSLDTIDNQYLDDESDEKFELTQTVYYICFKEVIRQTSVQCVERGLLIWKLWKSYLSLINKLNKNMAEKTKKLKKQHEQKVHQLHEFYEKEMNEMKKSAEKEKGEYEGMVKERNEKIAQLEKMKDHFMKEAEANKQRVEELEAQLKEAAPFKEKYETAKKVVMRLRDELTAFTNEPTTKPAAPFIKAIEKAKRLECIEEANQLSSRDLIPLKGSRKASSSAIDSEAQTSRQNTVEASTQTSGLITETIAAQEHRVVEIVPDIGKKVVRNVVPNTVYMPPPVIKPVTVTETKQRPVIKVAPNLIPKSETKVIVEKEEGVKDDRKVFPEEKVVAYQKRVNKVPRPKFVSKKAVITNELKKVTESPIASDNGGSINQEESIEKVVEGESSNAEQKPSETQDKPQTLQRKKKLIPSRANPAASKKKPPTTFAVPHSDEVVNPNNDEVIQEPMHNLAEDEVAVESAEQYIEDSYLPKTGTDYVENPVDVESPQQEFDVFPLEEEENGILYIDPEIEAEDHVEPTLQKVGTVEKLNKEEEKDIELHNEKNMKVYNKNESQAISATMYEVIREKAEEQKYIAKPDMVKLNKDLKCVQETISVPSPTENSKLELPAENTKLQPIAPIKENKEETTPATHTESPLKQKPAAVQQKRKVPIANKDLTHQNALQKSQNFIQTKAYFREIEAKIRKINELAARNKNLETELRELKTQFAALSDKFKQTATHQETLDKLVQKFENNHGEEADLGQIIGELRVVAERNKKTLETPLISPEKVRAIEVKEQNEAVPASEIFKEMARTAQSGFAVVEKSRPIAAHFKFAEFRLGANRPKLHYKQDFKVISELKNKAINQKQPVASLPLKLLLRMITYFYTLRIKTRKSNTGSDITLPTFIYKEFLTRYGLKHVADRKFLQVSFRTFIIFCRQWPDARQISTYFVQRCLADSQDFTRSGQTRNSRATSTFWSTCKNWGVSTVQKWKATILKKNNWLST